MILSAACQFFCPFFVLFRFNVFGSIVSSEVQTHLAVVLLVVDSGCDEVEVIVF